ncbi:hypothetical protein DsansV1_C04g0050281 [Dioscorea sansibarensis]
MPITGSGNVKLPTLELGKRQTCRVNTLGPSTDLGLPKMHLLSCHSVITKFMERTRILLGFYLTNYIS